MNHFRNIVCFFLCVSIFFGSFLNMENKSEAVAVSGAIATKELLAFILAAAAVGVTFDAVEEAQKVVDNYNNWFQKQYNKPSPPDWHDFLFGLLGVGAGAVVAKFSDIKDFFQSLGAKEGENNISSVDKIENLDIKDTILDIEEVHFYLYEKPEKEFIFHNAYYFRGGLGFSIYPYYNKNEREVYSVVKCTNGEICELRCASPILVVKSHKENDKFYISMSTNRYSSCSFVLDIPSENVDIPDYVKKETQSQKFNVSSDSFILNDDEKFIKKVYPNLDNLKNSSNIRNVVSSDGSVKRFYKGTQDEFLQELAENSTVQNAVTTVPQSVSIIDGEINLNPSTSVEPGENPGTSVEPGEEEIPFPDVTPSDEEVPTGLGKIISLLKQALNLNTRIFNRIGDFFKVPDDLQFDLDFDKLIVNDLRLIFPFCIPWDLKNAFSSFAAVAQEPQFQIDLDTSFFSVHHVVDISFMNYFVGFFRYSCIVAFTIFLILKTRDLMKW